tara:strand:- start:33 stop:5333 length:5301 start_codon:yes stop_codon:yes gene_type:complete
MEEEELTQRMLEYVTAYDSLQDLSKLDAQFPDLVKQYDPQVLHEYISTYRNPQYNQDTAIINAKFPELFGDVKKKDETVPQAPEPASSPLDGTDPSLDSPLPTDPSNGKSESEKPKGEYHIDPYSFAQTYQFGGLQELDSTLTPFMNIMDTEQRDLIQGHLFEGVGQVPLMDVIDNVAGDIAGNEELVKQLGIDTDEQKDGDTPYVPGMFGLPNLKPEQDIIGERQRQVSNLLNKKVYDKLGQTIIDNLPAEAREDETVLKGIEQQLLEDYGAYIDLTGEGEVGNTHFLKFEGFRAHRGGAGPQFSGFLVDKWNAGQLDLINAFRYAVNGFDTTPEIIETRQEAEELRRTTLQFVDGMTEGDFANFSKQMLGNFAEAGPQMSVVLPAGIATGGFGFGALTTSALIGFESASVATAVEAARVADNPQWSLYVRDGKSHNYQEALQIVDGNLERLATEFTVDDNASGKLGYLSNVFGTSFVADGASTFAFMRALKNTPVASLSGGARDLNQWWRYHAINTGLSIPVGGATGSLAAMQQFMAAQEAQGSSYTWAEVEAVGIDAGLTGASFGAGMSVAGAMINRAVARDPVGHDGNGMRFTMEENALLQRLSQAKTKSEINALNLQYQNLLRRRNQQLVRDEDYYSDMSDADLTRVYDISLEQNRLYRDIFKADEGSAEMTSLAERFDGLQQERLDIESIYNAQRPYAEEFVYTEVDGQPVRMIAPLILGEDPSSADATLLRSRPEGSSYVRFDDPTINKARVGWTDMFETIRKTQDLVQRARPEGVEGRRVSEEADIDIKLTLMDPRMALRIKEAINVRRNSGLYDRLGEAKGLMKGRDADFKGLLPEGVPLDNISLFDQYLTVLHVPERNRHILRQNQEEAAKLRAKSKLTDAETERLGVLEGYIKTNKGSGMSDAEAAAFLEALPDDIRAKFDEALPAVREMQQRIRDIYYEAGIYSEAQYKASMNTFEHYAPMHGRAIGEEWAAITGTDANGEPIYRNNDFAYTNAPSRIDVDGNLWKAAEGRSEATGNTLGKIIAQEAQAIMLAERNRVTQSVYRFVEQNPIDPKSLTREVRGETVTKDPYYRLVGKDENLPAEHTLTAYFDGVAKQVYFRDPDVVRQFKNGDSRITSSWADSVFEFLRKAANIRKTQTNFSPLFGPPAYVRDMQTGVIQALSMAEREFGYALHAADGSKVNSRKLIADMQAITPRAFGLIGQTEAGLAPGFGVIDTELGRYAAEYRRSGGETGFARVDEMRTLLRELRNETDPKKRTQMFLAKVGKSPFLLVEHQNNVFENTTRFAAYAAARKQGVSVDRAAALAKYVTVDFNRRGTYASQLGGMVFFYNATRQGIKQAVETMTAKKPQVDETGRVRSEAERRTSAQGIFAGMVAFGYAMANYNEMVSAVDETGRSEYSKIPDYIKKTNMIFMIPGTGERIEIPKAYGYGQFMDMGLVLGEIQHGIRNDDDAIFYLATALEHNFSPIAAGAKQEDKAKESLLTQELLSRAGNLMIADPLQPVADYAFNINHFGGNVFYDVEGRSRVSMNEGQLESMNAFLQNLNESTGGSEFVSGDADLPANAFDYFADFYLGGPYRFYNQIDESVRDWRAIKDLPEDQRPERLFDADDIPFLRSFYSDGNRNDVMQEYYSMKADIAPIQKEQRRPFTMIDVMDRDLPSRLQGEIDFRFGLPMLMEQDIAATDALASKVYTMRAALQREMRKNGRVDMFSSQERIDEYAKTIRDIEDQEALLIGQMSMVLSRYYELTPQQKYDK